MPSDRRPALRGGLLALLAATLFGVSTPLLQRRADAEQRRGEHGEQAAAQRGPAIGKRPHATHPTGRSAFFSVLSTKLDLLCRIPLILYSFSRSSRS